MSVLVVSNEFQTSHLSQLQEEMVEVAQLISHECMQECVVEQPVDVALPLVVLPIKAEIVDVVQQLSPQEHTSKSASSSSAWISWCRVWSMNVSQCGVGIPVPPAMEEQTAEQSAPQPREAGSR